MKTTRQHTRTAKAPDAGKIGRISALLALFIFASCAKSLSDGRHLKPAEGFLASFESKYTRYTKGQQFIGQTYPGMIAKSWCDTLWRNERSHKQLILWTTNEPCENLTYQVGELSSGGQVIPASAVRLRFCTYVLGDKEPFDCGGLASHPRQDIYVADALSDTPVTRVEKDDPIKAWLTVDVPADAVPGKYTGSVKVFSQGELKHDLGLELLVLDRTLPPPPEWKFHLDLWQFPWNLREFILQSGQELEPFSEQHFAILEPFYRILGDAGQKAISTPIISGGMLPGQTMVRWSKGANGVMSYDYAWFDLWVEHMMQWGITQQISCFTLLSGVDRAAGTANIVYRDEKTGAEKTETFLIGSEPYNAYWLHFLDSFKAHLESKGWFSKAVLYMDEVSHELVQKVIDLVHGHDPAWKIGMAGSYMPTEIESKLYDFSTFLGRESFMNSQVKTFYTSCSSIVPSNYVTQSGTPAELAWMGWHAAANGYDGTLRWAYDYWRCSDPADARDGGFAAGDFHMIYRSNNFLSATPVASIRMEMLREGIQAFEKIRLLDDPRLNALLPQFTLASGADSKAMVTKGESLIKKVSAGN